MKDLAPKGSVAATAALFALVAWAGSAAFGRSQNQLNGSFTLAPGASLGQLEAAPDGCLVSYTVNIVTAAGGGQDEFELQIADDGRLTRIVPLAAPADGASHVVSGSFWLSGPPGSLTPGIGIYLVDNGSVLDAVDPLGVPCGIVEVPALAGKGYLALGSVLALVALVSLRRPRRAKSSA